MVIVMVDEMSTMNDEPSSGIHSIDKWEKVMIKIFNVLAMVILCAESVSLFSSMKSVNGKNIDFVVNTVKKMTMTTTGVGVGTESPRSNFEVHGTWGKGFLSVASDVTLGTNSLVFVDTSAGNCTLTLPSAVDFSNQIYTVKKTVNENNLYLDGGGHLIDLDHVKKLGVSNDDLSSATVISNGQKWLTLSSAGNVDPIDATYSENLQLWLDASDLSTLTLVSGNVTSWADRSGKGHHATQFPAYRLRWIFILGKRLGEADHTEVNREIPYTEDRSYGFERLSSEESDVALLTFEKDYVISQKLFFFSVDLKEGNYKVTITLPQTGSKYETTIRSETRLNDGVDIF
jgi:hypothetical protein